jgi:uncharacterized protein (DUF1501 family)
VLTRRQLLALAGGATAAGALGVYGVRELVDDDGSGRPAARASGADRVAVPEGRVLVVVQLTGGNDALNTLVPVEAGAYHDARPDLGLRDADVTALAGASHALHPALAPLVPLWESGDLAWMASVGFPDASRSHFESMDRWWTAEGAAETGWLGRWLDATAPGSSDPDSPLRAVALGPGSPALRAEAPSVAARSLERFDFASPRGVADDAFSDLWRTATAEADGPLAAALAASVDSSIEAETALGALDAPEVPQPRSAAGGAGDGGDEEEAAGRRGEIASGLATAASIIEADLGTQVVLVGGGGFDTHANQAPQHERLLADLAGGVTGLFDRLSAAGLDDRVLLVTTSEFGRRVAQNASGGTDHGLGSVHLVVGRGVDGGRVVGDLDLGRLVDGDLPAAIDTRSLYAVALSWLGGPVEEVLGRSYETHGLLA